MNYNYLNQQHKLRNQFILSNYVMQLGLSAIAVAIYCYLMYIEDRKTHECYPSYKTIGKALDIKSRNTIAKYVRELEEKCFISTEPTEVTLKDGTKRNVNLKYKIRPIQDAIDHYHQEQMKQFQEDIARAEVQRKLDEYDKKHSKESA